MGKKQTQMQITFPQMTSAVMAMAMPWLTTPDVPRPKTIFRELRIAVKATAMWGVQIADLPDGALPKLLTELTCIPNERHLKKTPWRKPVTFCLGVVDKGTHVLWLPPWYACQVFPNATVTLALHMGRPMQASVAFTGVLRDHPPQKQAAATYLKWIASHRATPSCILSLPCGYGKTVLCISLLTALKRCALVLAHTNALVDQWLEELRRFMSPDARLGFIKESGSVVFQDCDVVVASLASLLSHKRAGAPYLAEFLPQVGTVVLDEGHHAVAATFWEVLGMVPAAFRIVLTATPRRRDGLTNQLSWVTGPVVFRVKRTTGTAHVVHVQYTGLGHEDLPASKRHVMVQRLCADPVRTQLAVAIAAYLVLTQHRRVVIVTHLCEHVDQLTRDADAALRAARVPPREASVFHGESFRKPRRKPGMSDAEDAAITLQARMQWEATAPHGVHKVIEVPLAAAVRTGCSTLERDTAFEAHVVVATFPMLAEGVSYKQWDTLIDLGNTPDCEQVVGRILRECATKRVPLVVDFWMDIGLFKGTHWSRVKYYTQERFRQKSIEAASAAVLDWSMWAEYDVDASVVEHDARKAHGDDDGDDDHDDHDDHEETCDMEDLL